MPIGQGIWRISEGKPERIAFSPLRTESRLEESLIADFDILDADLLVIGRQVPTAFGKFIDVLAIDRDGNLTIVELKRDKTPREVVAQVLDYASWVSSLTHDQITGIFSSFCPGEVFEQTFVQKFEIEVPDELNEEHRLLIVASDLDPATERIIKYLSDGYGVPLNVAFFNYFKDGQSEYLTRTWLIDPNEAEAKTDASTRKRGREPWNGRDFYVSFGDSAWRSWDDATKYGFISAGGGKWYSRTLSMLTPGARLFACIPKVGYVGVGTVRSASVPIRDFIVERDGVTTPLLKLPLTATKMNHNEDKDDLCEWVVGVDWQKTVPAASAIWEKGMFANQNSASKLRNKFTLEMLVQRFAVEA
jgi:hypothetical protein